MTMKKHLFLFIFMLSPMLASAEDVKIDETTFPDSNFRNWVLSQEYGVDGILTDEELKNVTDLDVRRLEIHDLKGIEYFTALKVLNCMTNKLTTLDLSHNTALEKLECVGNRLTTINLRENKKLRYLSCPGSNPGNQLTALDVSGCTELDTLACSGNPLTTLDVSMNTKLTCLECYSNQLTALDLSRNTALRRIHCNNNQLTTLDVSKNTALTLLQCSSNLLTTLDVTKNSAMTSLSCTDNKLTTLFVSNNKSLEWIFCFNNQLASLDVSGCSALKTLSCTGNQLTTLELSGCSALEEVQCNDNQLTTLDLSENTALARLFCYHNQIKGAGMDALVESLHIVSGGSLNIMYFENEQNVMTNTQVAAAKAKGWTPYLWAYDHSKEYAGLETTTMYFPEGTKWTEIRLDTLKYDSWYSKVGDEWVPNFETIEYYVKGEYVPTTLGVDYQRKYTCVYTNSQEWTDSLTLMINEDVTEYDTTIGVMTPNLIEEFALPGEAYQLEWHIGKELFYKSIVESNATSPVVPQNYGIIEFTPQKYGIIENIKEGVFGGIKPLKYVDMNGVRIIHGIGVTEWKDGECLFGQISPYLYSFYNKEEKPKERHYRSMLVHFERNGEVLYSVWPKKEMAYRPMIEEGKVWKVGTISGNPVQIVDYYYFDGDTIINGKTCKQMMCQHFTSPNYPYYEYLSQPNSLRYVGAWYEEDQKVYFYDERKQSMVLKYDFSLGDYETLDFLNVDGYPPYIIGPKQTGGIEGFKGVYRDIMMGQDIRNTTWLEGIGGLDAPFRNAYDPRADLVPEFLMSCVVGDEVIYHNDEYEDGATPAGARKNRFDFTHTHKIKPKARTMSEEEPSLYGEYNDQRLDINLGLLDDTYQVCITNGSGKAVYEKVIYAGNIVALNIDISDFAKDRYTVTVENSRESFSGEFETLKTGIEENVKIKKLKNVSIYNLQGQRLNSLQKGLNIVNGKKIYVK